VRPTDQIHDETVGMISDAVTELTRRAVAPTLEPFGKALRDVSGRLEERISDIGDVTQELREWQGLSANAQARLEGTLQTQSEMLDDARGRYESLATQLQALQDRILQARDDTLAVVREQGEVLTAHSNLLQAQADALETQRHTIRVLSEAITRMTRELHDNRSGQARSVAELSTLISSTRADITASEEKIAQLQSQGERLGMIARSGRVILTVGLVLVLLEILAAALLR